MRPIRSLATALLVASLAVTGCGRSQPDESASQPSQPPAATAPPATKAPAPGGTTKSPPVVLVDGRHPVFLKTVDPAGRLITFDLIQLYFGEEAKREELKDHDTHIPGAQRRLPAQRQPQAADAARSDRRDHHRPRQRPRRDRRICVACQPGGRPAAPGRHAVLDHRAAWPGGEDRRAVHPVATANQRLP